MLQLFYLSITHCHGVCALHHVRNELSVNRSLRYQLKFNLSFIYDGQMRNITEFTKLIVISANMQFQIQSKHVQQIWARNMANDGHITYSSQHIRTYIHWTLLTASCSETQLVLTARGKFFVPRS
jgi:hypothetical protein